MEDGKIKHNRVCIFNIILYFIAGIDRSLTGHLKQNFTAKVERILNSKKGEKHEIVSKFSQS